MNFAQDNQSGSRMTSFGVVILLHVVLIYALASGLARKVVEAVKGPIETKVIEEVKPPPPEPQKIVPPPPDLKAPPPPFVPIPEVQVSSPNPPPATPSTSVAPPPAPTVPVAAAPVAAPTPAPVAQKTTAAALGCTMVKPEAPAISYEGVAEFKVFGTVRGGKVISKEVIPVKAIPDKRAQRAVVKAIEEALDQYKCNSEGNFEQPFLFRFE